jgi:hypothetical protein
VVRFRLSENGVVAGRIDPVGKPKGRPGMEVSWRAKRGRNVRRVSARKLRPGRYRLTIAAEDPDGNETNPVRATFRVKKPRKPRRRR